MSRIARTPRTREPRPQRADESGSRVLDDVRRILETGEQVVIETSGSTGVPKKVGIGGAALRASAEATARRLGEGRWVLALSTGYIAGLQVLVRSAIAETVPVTLPQGPFRADAFAAATRKAAGGGAALYTALVPAQLATLLDAAVHDAGAAAALRAYEAILVGGQSLPQPLRERASDAGARIVRTYGSSETSGGCVYDGIPLDIATVRIVEGEVRVAGPMLADGYLGDDRATAHGFVTDDDRRWYRTGDLGSFDDGVLQVIGRADNVIISGGVNISLDRVERVVRGVPGLADAVVIPVSDARWGQASVVVTTAQDRGLLAQARAAVAAEIGKPARPACFLIVDEIPLLSSGKPDRARLRERGEDAGDPQR